MKKLLSTDYSSAAFNFSMLTLRVSTGLWLITKHGLIKLRDFSTLQSHFYNFMGKWSSAGFYELNIPGPYTSLTPIEISLVAGTPTEAVFFIF